MCFQSMFLPNFQSKLCFHIFGYQLNCYRFYVGLTFPMTRIEAFTPLIYFVLTFFLFGRCIMFFFLMQKHKFKLFNLDLVELKSSSFLMSTLYFVTFQNVPFFKGIDERLKRI